MKKKGLGVLVLLLAVGFATVSTVLYINGTVNVSTNKDDFNIIFTDAKATQNNLTTSKTLSTASATIESDKKNITFSTQDLAVVGEWAQVDYEISNYSRDYDAEVTVAVTLDDPTQKDLVDEYLSITTEENWKDDKTIEAGTRDTGWVKVSVKKAYLGDSDVRDPKEIKFKVTYTANAKERSTKANELAQKNNSKVWTAVVGDGTQVGDEIAVGEEHFYVISNDGTTLNALAKYNLNVGPNAVSGTTGIQNSQATGWVSGGKRPYPGAVVFSNNNGWPNANNADINIKDYAGPVKTALYDENTGYEKYIQQTAQNATVRLITKAEIEALVNDGATLSSGSIKAKADAKGYQWLYSTTYWCGSADADDADFVWFVNSGGNFSNYGFSVDNGYGVRPVISLES